MVINIKWKPTNQQHRKWEKIFFENKYIPLSLITTTQARSFVYEENGMIFVDREPEKEKIKKILESISQLKQTIAVRISGAGGVGKTHFLRYLQHLIKTKVIVRDLDLNIENIQFDCCILDAPKKEETFNFHYIYTQMWEGFGRENFFEEFSIIIFRKFLRILNDMASYQVDEKLKKIFGEDWRFWKDLNHLKLRNRIEILPLEKFNEFKLVLENNFRQIFLYIKKEYMPKNIRTLFTNALSLLDIFIPDYNTSMQVIDSWQLTNLDELMEPAIRDQETLTKFMDLLEIYSWIYPNYVWILALDDLDHLNEPNITQKFFDLMKIFRNSTHNFCIILTATIDQWTYFDDSMMGTDKQKQLEGIFTSELSYFDMDYLPEHEMLNWLGRIIQKWWLNFNIALPPDGQWYPFSREALEFIINYDPNDKTPRTVGNRLLDLWNKLTKTFLTSGRLYVESEFKAWKLLSKADYTKLNPYIQKLLISYRKKEKYGTFSGAIEEGLKTVLQVLKKSQEFRLVEIVDIQRNKEFFDDKFKTKSKKRKADVLITLQEPGGPDFVKIEFQVKAGDPNREITYDELESSFELLKYNYTNFLIILSFSELNSLIKSRLEKYSGRYNITATNLSEEQQAYCVLIAYFKEIAGRNLTPFEAANIFSKIFGESPHIFFRSWLKRKPPEEKKGESEEKEKEKDGEEEEKKKKKEGDTPIQKTIKWMIKKGLERTGQFKNRITKTWLLNRKDCPEKDLLNKAWKKIIDETKYGELIKTSFCIDEKKIDSLFESKLEQYM
ncbi:MAG: P-loop NTPase fold protein [Candidatus Odinarchaeota archaeon]